MATYGEGDPTDNAQELYENLQQGDLNLNGLKYAVNYDDLYFICLFNALRSYRVLIKWILLKREINISPTHFH